MLQNAYLVAKIGADTTENEQHFAEILPIGRRVADRSGVVSTAAKLPAGSPGAGAVGWWAGGCGDPAWLGVPGV